MIHSGIEETGGKRRDLGEWWPGTKCPKVLLGSLVVGRSELETRT